MERDSGHVSTVRRIDDADGDIGGTDDECDRAHVRAAEGTGDPAMQPCLACGQRFPLTPANHDGYGPVCPNCGCLI